MNSRSGFGHAPARPQRDRDASAPVEQVGPPPTTHGPSADVQDSALTAAWSTLLAADPVFAALVADWLARDAELLAVQAQREPTVFFKANRRDAGDRGMCHAASMATKGKGR